MPEDTVQAVVTVTAIAIVGVIAVAIMGPVADVAKSGTAGFGATSFDPTTGQQQTLDSGVEEAPAEFDVSLTQGFAIDTSGSGHIETETPAGLTTGSWTVCAAGQLADGAPTGGSFALLGIENESIVLQYDDGQFRGFANVTAGTGNVTLAANETSLSEHFTPVCLRFNATSSELTLSVNETVSAPAPLTGGTRTATTTWDGTIDELRLFNQTVSNQTMRDIGAEPVAGVGIEEDARYMFEEGEGDTSDAFFSDATATLANGSTFTTGAAGPGLERGTDYQRSVDPLAVTPLAGGAMAASPVAYAEWASPLGGGLEAFLGGVDSSLSLFPVVMIALLATVVLARVRTLQ